MNSTWMPLGRAIVDCSRISAVTCAVPEGDCYRLYLIVDTVELELPRVAADEMAALLAKLGADSEQFTGRNQRNANSSRAYAQ